MNYHKLYNQIIERAKKRELGGYVEKHHIVPKSLGGLNSKENIVPLTAREHFLCHYLLTKIYPENRKLVFAFYSMCHQKRFCQDRYFPRGKVYEQAKKHRRLLGISFETRKKMVDSRIGHFVSVETRKKNIKK